MKKKPTQAKIARKLFLQAERLWKEFCHKRDGKGCMVQKAFPEMKTPHTTVYQVDHFISRRNKLLFFDVRNGTVVCSACNAKKGFGDKAVGMAIDKIVVAREGEKNVREMLETTGINRDWKRAYWLEEIVVKLMAQLADLAVMNDRAE